MGLITKVLPTVSLNHCIASLIKHIIKAETCEISGSHGGEYEDDSVLGYNAM
jgi:hypothetical protein